MQESVHTLLSKEPPRLVTSFDKPGVQGVFVKLIKHTLIHS